MLKEPKTNTDSLLPSLDGKMKPFTPADKPHLLRCQEINFLYKTESADERLNLFLRKRIDASC